MILTPAEQQLIKIIRAAKGHDLSFTVRVRGDRYTVQLAAHDGPGTGTGHGDSFDLAWRDMSEERARRAG